MCFFVLKIKKHIKTIGGSYEEITDTVVLSLLLLMSCINGNLPLNNIDDTTTADDTFDTTSKDETTKDDTTTLPDEDTTAPEDEAAELIYDGYWIYKPLSNNSYEIALNFDEDYPEAIVIPGNYNGKPVTRIGDKAFVRKSNLGFSSNWDIISLVIPASIEEIGSDAFYYNAGLTSVVFEEGSKLTKLKYGVFKSCSALENINLPEGLKSIGDSAFSGNGGLKHITVPNSVTNVGENVFLGYQAIDIFYHGTPAEWEKISKLLPEVKPYERDDLIKYISTVYFYSETEPVGDGDYWRYVEGVPTPW
ncbi:MAG: leucine-rich repeat domain-containing protein [Clostridia bacterium]|nr:leucine-rich repeat domain-containing protein [Clostridia bacterium]